jgi:hypothetical protein
MHVTLDMSFPFTLSEDQNRPVTAAVLFEFFKDVHSIDVDVVHVAMEVGNS